MPELGKSWPSRIRRLTTVVLMLCAALSSAQSAPAKNAPPAQKGAQADATRKLTAEQERGLRLLKASEAEAAGLEPDMHAYILWRVSFAYTKVDAKKAEKLAQEAFAATQAIEDPTDPGQCGAVGSAGDIKGWIQERVLSGMVQKQKIAEAEQLLPQATEPVRNRITQELVRYCAGKKEFSHAQTVLSQLADSPSYPFAAAADLLLAMGPELSADRMTIFTQALNNFEQHGEKQTMGMDDMGNLIEKAWGQVPPAVVLEAINKLLEQAKANKAYSPFFAGSLDDSITLNSAYELRLFQLLPVLEELDKDKAESLLRDNAVIKAQLAKHPKGMTSFLLPEGLSSYAIYDNPQISAQAAQESAETQAILQVGDRVNRTVGESLKDPAQAFTDAMNLPVQSVGGGAPRSEALVQIAEETVMKKPSVAKSALDEIGKVQDQLTPDQVSQLATLPHLYMELGDEDGAKKALKALVKAAGKIYEHDIDAEDPNKAFKGTWPSADLWRKCVQAAAKISPALAEEIIAEIPDPDIAAAQKIAFASSLLGVSGEAVLVGDCRKAHSSFNFSN